MATLSPGLKESRLKMKIWLNTMGVHTFWAAHKHSGAWDKLLHLLSAVFLAKNVRNKSPSTMVVTTHQGKGAVHEH